MLATDEEIRAAVADAELPPLLAALAHLTGEPLPHALRPPTISRLVEQGGYTPEQVASARALAASMLTGIRDGALPAGEPAADGASLLAPVRFLTGGAAERYLPLLMDEIAAGRADPDAPRWPKDDVAPGREFSVVIIGAGMSGLLAGYRLGQAGVPYTILEKNDGPGGTWLENSYPGCRVDVSNHLYSYSFWQRDDWPQYFSTRDVLLGYFREFADEHGVSENIRYSWEVTDLTFDEESCTWAVRAAAADGRALDLRCQAVISAVGQLNRPRYPAIAGLAGFAGPCFHSARWDHGADLRGQRVAVIGTGASAFQFVPEIAEQAGQLTIFQRTPAWLGPTPAYHAPVAAGLAWLLRHLPGYAQWYRFWLFCSSVEGGLPNVYVDPDWPVSERSVSAANDRAWGVSSVSTWYKNALGRVAQNWPFTLMEYWERTRAPDLRDFELL